MLKDIDSDERRIEEIKQETQQSKNLYDILERSLLGPDLSNCSCADCDSLQCFTLRRDSAQTICACKDCVESKTCFLNSNVYYPEGKNPNNPRIEENSRSAPKNVDFNDAIECKEVIKCEHEHFDTTINSRLRKFPEKYRPMSSDRREICCTSKVFLCPTNNIANTTAQLSAQIMDVPIQDFNNSLSMKNPRDEFLTEITNTKNDIFSRLKEIYKACSCKVCECIPVTSIFPKSEACSCKPCECSECRHLYQYISSIKESPHEGCPCIRCDREDCRGVNKEKTDGADVSCNCKPCDCIKCSESFSKPCNCEPCDCAECRHMPSYPKRTFTVAPLRESIQRNLCDCSPCECSNCTHNYNTTSNVRESSAGTVTHSYCPCDTCHNDRCQSDGENCRCKSNKNLMNKPIQRNGHDYDIRSVLLTDVWPKINNNTHTSKDVITMNAEIKNDYLGFKEKTCDCRDCACIACVNQNTVSKSGYSIKTSVSNGFNLPAIKNICRCEPCECGTCNKEMLNDDVDKRLKITKCKCNICDCVTCMNSDIEATLSEYKKPIHQEFVANFAPNHCDCNSCECVSCAPNNTEPIFKNELLFNVSNREEQYPKLASNLDINIDKSQKPSKMFLRAMTRDTSIKTKRSKSKVFRNKRSVSVYRVVSRHHVLPKRSMTILDSNPDESMLYLNFDETNIDRAQGNSGKEQLIISENNTGRDRSLVNGTSMSLFAGKSHSIFFHNELSKHKMSSHQLIVDEPEQSLPGSSESKDLCKSIKISKEQKYSESQSNDNLRYSESVGDKNNGAFNYESVLCTLQDAQEFQGKLINLFQAYESANNNFISISAKLKDHKSIVNSNYNETTRLKLQNIQLEKCTENNINGCDGLSKYHAVNKKSVEQKSSLTSQTSDETETKMRPILGSHNLLQDMDLVEFQRRIHRTENQENAGDVTQLSKTSYSKTRSFPANRISKRLRTYKEDNKYSKFITEHLKSNSRVLIKRQFSKKVIGTITSDGCKKTLFNKCINTNDTIDQKDIILSPAVTSTFKDADYYKDVGTDSDGNYSAGGQDKMLKSNSNDKQTEPKNKKKKSLHNVDSRNILKKNLYINSDQKTQNRYTCKMPLLEVNVKEVVEVISQQIRRDLRKNTVPNVRKNTDNLDSIVNNNIKHFLHRIISNAIIKSDSEHIKGTLLFTKRSLDKNVISDAKHESLKASFCNLRRISDHTVMVKWNTPQAMNDVVGYEIDGRSIQKIFNPTRSIAVVTCLPHSDKVLLSIRTLTKNPEISPTTTTIYRPRNK